MQGLPSERVLISATDRTTSQQIVWLPIGAEGTLRRAQPGRTIEPTGGSGRAPASEVDPEASSNASPSPSSTSPGAALGRAGTAGEGGCHRRLPVSAPARQSGGCRETLCELEALCAHALCASRHAQLHAQTPSTPPCFGPMRHARRRATVQHAVGTPWTGSSGWELRRG